MQTFLPYPDFALSAQVLDRQRLGKQRVEAKQIILALESPTYGWQNHPAVKMWRGHEVALARYGVQVCKEWRARGYKDSLLPFFEERAVLTSYMLRSIAWLTSEFCHAHQSNLIRKMPEHYRQFWPDVPPDLPYIWPVA